MKISSCGYQGAGMPDSVWASAYEVPGTRRILFSELLQFNIYSRRYLQNRQKGKQDQKQKKTSPCQPQRGIPDNLFPTGTQNKETTEDPPPAAANQNPTPRRGTSRQGVCYVPEALTTSDLSLSSSGAPYDSPRSSRRTSPLAGWQHLSAPPPDPI